MKTEIYPINPIIQIRAQDHDTTQREIIIQAMDLAANQGLSIVKIDFHPQYPYNASITLQPSPEFRKYLKAPSSCPFCNSSNITALHWDAESGMAWQEVDCLNCGKEWHDIYQLSHYELRGED